MAVKGLQPPPMQFATAEPYSTAVPGAQQPKPAYSEQLLQPTPPTGNWITDLRNLPVNAIKNAVSFDPRVMALGAIQQVQGAYKGEGGVKPGIGSAALAVGQVAAGIPAFVTTSLNELMTASGLNPIITAIAVFGDDKQKEAAFATMNDAQRKVFESPLNPLFAGLAVGHFAKGGLPKTLEQQQAALPKQISKIRPDWGTKGEIFEPPLGGAPGEELPPVEAPPPLPAELETRRARAIAKIKEQEAQNAIPSQPVEPAEGVGGVPPVPQAPASAPASEVVPKPAEVPAPKSRLSAEAQAKMERLRQKFVTDRAISPEIDEQDLKDLIDIAREYISIGLADNKSFGEKLVAGAGEWVRPHIDRIRDALATEVTPAGAKEAVVPEVAVSDVALEIINDHTDIHAFYKELLKRNAVQNPATAQILYEFVRDADEVSEDTKRFMDDPETVEQYIAKAEGIYNESTNTRAGGQKTTGNLLPGAESTVEGGGGEVGKGGGQLLLASDVREEYIDLGDALDGTPGGFDNGTMEWTDSDQHIATIRANATTAAVDDGRVDNPNGVLNPPQVQASLKAYDRMKEGKGFWYGGGPGTGKTRIALCAANQHAKDGRPVLIVAPRLIVGIDWKKGEDGEYKFAGEYKYVSDLSGIKVRVLKEGSPAPGEIILTTYDAIGTGKIKVDANTVIIFDESQALKNVASQRSVKSIDLIEASSKGVLFLTATPGDVTSHYWYLEYAGLGGGKVFHQTMLDLGFIRKSDPNGHLGWVVSSPQAAAKVTAKLYKVFEDMTRANQALAHNISLAGVEVITDYMPSTPELDAQNARINSEIRAMKPGFFGAGKAVTALRFQQETHKITRAAELATKELDEGRKVVIYVARISESEVKGRGGRVIAQSEGTAGALRDELMRRGVSPTRIIEMHGASSTSVATGAARFQAGGGDVIIGTIESAGAGINLDDQIGNAPRSVILVTMPWMPSQVIQTVLRIHRLGTKSAARVIIMYTDTHVDRHSEGIITQKMKTLMAAVPTGASILAGKGYAARDAEVAKANAAASEAEKTARAGRIAIVETEQETEAPAAEEYRQEVESRENVDPNTILTLPKILQPREDEYSQESYDSMVREEKSHPGQANPTLEYPLGVWQPREDSNYEGVKKDGSLYVFNGNTRLKFCTDYNYPVSIRVVKGLTLDQAKEKAVKSNSQRTGFTTREDASTVKEMLAEGKSLDAVTDAFKNRARLLIDLSGLAVHGHFLEAYNTMERSGDRSNFPNLEPTARRLGKLRRKFREENNGLTNEHERQIFQFLYGDMADNSKEVKKARRRFMKMTAEEMERMVEVQLNHSQFDNTQPLSLTMDAQAKLLNQVMTAGGTSDIAEKIEKIDQMIQGHGEIGGPDAESAIRQLLGKREAFVRIGIDRLSTQEAIPGTTGGLFQEKQVDIFAEGLRAKDEKTVSDALSGMMANPFMMAFNPHFSAALFRTTVRDIRAGTKNFVGWSRTMVKRFGDTIRRYLAGAWRMAKAYLEGDQKLVDEGIQLMNAGFSLQDVYAKTQTLMRNYKQRSHGWKPKDVEQWWARPRRILQRFGWGGKYIRVVDNIVTSTNMMIGQFTRPWERAKRLLTPEENKWAAQHYLDWVYRGASMKDGLVQDILVNGELPPNLAELHRVYRLIKKGLAKNAKDVGMMVKERRGVADAIMETMRQMKYVEAQIEGEEFLPQDEDGMKRRKKWSKAQRDNKATLEDLKAMQEQGITHTTEEIWVPFKDLPNHVSYSLSGRAHRAMATMVGEDWEAVKAYVARAFPNDGIRQGKYLKLMGDMLNPELAAIDRQCIALEAHRSEMLYGELPGFMIEHPSGTPMPFLNSDVFQEMDHYIMNTSRRIATVGAVRRSNPTRYAAEEFQNQQKMIMDFMNELKKGLLSEYAGMSNVTLAQGVWRALHGIQKHTSEQAAQRSKAADNLLAIWDFSTAQMLGAGAIANILGGHYPIIALGGQGGIRRWMRAVETATKGSPWMGREIKDLGDSEQQRLLNYTYDLGGWVYNCMYGLGEIPTEDTSHSRVKRFTAAELRILQFERANRFLNKVASLAALDYLQERIIQIGHGHSRSKQFVKEMTITFGWTEAEIMDIVTRGEPTEFQKAKAIQTFVAQANVFRTSPLDVPIWMQTNIGRRLLALSSFFRSMSYIMADGIQQARNGNFEKLIYMFFGGQISDIAQNAVKKFLKDQDRDDESFWNNLLLSVTGCAGIGLLGKISEAMIWADRKGDSMYEGISKLAIPPQLKWFAGVLTSLHNIAKYSDPKAFHDLIKMNPAAAILLVNLQRLGNAFEVLGSGDSMPGVITWETGLNDRRTPPRKLKEHKAPSYNRKGSGRKSGYGSKSYGNYGNYGR